jgi:hypothetical protein
MTATMSAPVGGRLGLHRVVVDVSCGDDHVLVRRRPRGNRGLSGLALSLRGVDAGEGGLRVRLERRANGGQVRSTFATVDLGPEREPLGGVLHVVRASEQRAPEKIAYPTAEEAFALVALHRDVDERGAAVVEAIDAVRAQDRALGSDARVAIDVTLDVVGDGARELAAAGDFLRVHGDVCHPRCLP